LSINPDAAIRGHVFVSLPALTLAKEVIPKRYESDSSRFGQARAALEHFQGLMRQHLRALV
jgi:hypothetical protein